MLPCPSIPFSTYTSHALFLPRRSSSLGVPTHTSLASQHTHPLPFCLLPHSHPLPTFSSHALFLPLLSNTHIPSLLHLAVLCPVSHTHRLPSPLTRSSSVGATRTSLALHTSQRALSRVCADGHSPNLSPSPKHYSCLSIETLAFYTEGQHTVRDYSFARIGATHYSRLFFRFCTRIHIPSVPGPL